MPDAYDPFAALAEQSAAARASQEKYALERARKEAWDKAVSAAINRMDPATLLDFGGFLRDRDVGFWLELLECRLARDHHVVEVLHFGHYHPWINFPSRVVALRLLKGAFVGSDADLKSILRNLDEVLFQRIRYAFEEVVEILTEQARGHSFPGTPWMTKKELADACRSRLPHFSKSGITKKIASGDLVVTDSMGPARGGYHTFELGCPNGDRSRQLILLEPVVIQIRKCEATSFFCEAVWPRIS